MDGTVEVPNVSTQKVDWEMVGERTRTAGGLLRQDVTAMKRQWRVESVFLTHSQYATIVDKLEAGGWGPIPFWLDEFGGVPATDSVLAFISVEDDERVQFRADDGSWENQGRRLVLTVKER